MPKKITWRGHGCTGTESERCPPACLETRPVSGQTEEHAQTDQVQAVSRAPGRTWKASSWHPHSVRRPHIFLVWHYHAPRDTNGGLQESRDSVHSQLLQSPGRLGTAWANEQLRERGHKDATQSFCWNAGCPNWFWRMFWRLTGL